MIPEREQTFDQWWSHNKHCEPCWRLRQEEAWVIYKAGKAARASAPQQSGPSQVTVCPFFAQGQSQADAIALLREARVLVYKVGWGYTGVDIEKHANALLARIEALLAGSAQKL